MAPGVLDVSRYGYTKFLGVPPQIPSRNSAAIFLGICHFAYTVQSPLKKKALRQFGGLMSERDSD